MDQAAVFLAGSILTALGFVVVVMGIVVINNIISRYWKPIRIFTEDSWHSFGSNARFVEPQEIEKMQDPAIDKKVK